MTITEKNLAEKLAGIYGDINDYDWPAVARTAAEELGVELAPEPPAPGWYLTEDGGVARVKPNKHTGALILHIDGDVLLPHQPWPQLTPARVIPATTTPVTLTEDQVGEVWDQECGRANTRLTWATFTDRWKHHVTATVNATLAQHATPAEDMPDWDDVRNAVASQRGNGWSLNDDAINGITDAVMRLLHREEA